MLLYNTTFAIDSEIESEVIDWIKTRFMPSAINEDYFSSPQLFKVMSADNDVISLAVHLYCESPRHIEHWYADRGSRLFSEAIERWNQKCVFFSTTLVCL